MFKQSSTQRSFWDYYSTAHILLIKRPCYVKPKHKRQLKAIIPITSEKWHLWTASFPDPSTSEEQHDTLPLRWLLDAIIVQHVAWMSLIHWHTPSKNVAVLTTSCQWAMSDALRHVEFSPRFNGLRSLSTVRRQEVAGRPGHHFDSGGGLWSAAATTLWWSLGWGPD